MNDAPERPLALDPARPHSYPRRVLVSVVGGTPAVLTETVYALATQPDPFVPTEVWVITTTVGRKVINDLLLQPIHDGSAEEGTGARTQWGLLWAEWLPEVKTPPRPEIEVIKAEGVELADLNTAEHQVAAADSILNVVRKLTLDPNCAVHASIAGGRKTMSFYMGYSMSLCMREQDRVSHVLASTKFEDPTRFFPTKVDIENNRWGPEPITLAPVGLVRLNEVTAKHLRDEKAVPSDGRTTRFRDLIEGAQKSLESRVLKIDCNKREISYGGKYLHPARSASFAWYLFFAMQKAAGIALENKEAETVKAAREAKRKKLEKLVNDAKTKHSNKSKKEVLAAEKDLKKMDEEAKRLKMLPKGAIKVSKNIKHSIGIFEENDQAVSSPTPSRSLVKAFKVIDEEKENLLAMLNSAHFMTRFTEQISRVNSEIMNSFPNDWEKLQIWTSKMPGNKYFGTHGLLGTEGINIEIVEQEKDEQEKEESIIQISPFKKIKLKVTSAHATKRTVASSGRKM